LRTSVIREGEVKLCSVLSRRYRDTASWVDMLRIAATGKLVVLYRRMYIGIERSRLVGVERQQLVM
tara:strand:+ start:2759 stop:2956 length:198 start_codon:yes stop_codon:yes gene_type:complete